MTENERYLSEHWWYDACVYHIYPLGFCDAPADNPAAADACETTPAASGDDSPPRIDRLLGAIDHICSLGCTAVYLGPLLESSRHGYDTADYFRLDRRLGTNEDFARVVAAFHAAGLRIILDGVFNHVGRDFHAFRRLREITAEHHSGRDPRDRAGAEGSRHDRPLPSDSTEQDRLAAWFKGIDRSQESPFGDSFAYAGWEGNFDLVELNLANREVREHIFSAVRWLIEEIQIDGLRLDVAYSLPRDFLCELRSVCDESYARGRSGKRFFLLGEVIHGDYGEYLGEELLDSVTNYECYKGLWSSLNDRNFHEIAHSLARHFTPGGISEGAPLYNFTENHDVDRVASRLDHPEHLFPLYALLFALPGMPSLYYGGEFGLTGQKVDGDDAPLRPAWRAVTGAVNRARSEGESSEHKREDDRASQAKLSSLVPALRDFIAELAGIRRAAPALRHGSYRQLHVDHGQIAFARETQEQSVVVVVNADAQPARIVLGELGSNAPLEPDSGSDADIEIEIPDTGNRVGAGSAVVLESLFFDRSRISVDAGTATVDIPARGCVIAGLISVE